MLHDSPTSSTPFVGWVWLGAIIGGVASVILLVVSKKDEADIILLFILPPPLAIVGAACGAIARKQWWPMVFVVLCLVAGFGYWWATDWVVYVDLGERGRMPKFELYPVEQFAFSAVVGVFLGSLLTGVAFALSRVLQGQRTRENTVSSALCSTPSRNRAK